MRELWMVVVTGEVTDRDVVAAGKGKSEIARVG